MNSAIMRRTGHKKISYIDTLSGFDPAYRLMYKIGSGLGCTVRQLLSLTVDNVKNKGYLEASVGPLQIRRSWYIPTDVQEEIRLYTNRRNGSAPLFILQDGSRLTDRQASVLFNSLGLVDGSFLPITMRRYYDVTGDIAYPAHMLNVPENMTKELLGI